VKKGGENAVRAGGVIDRVTIAGVRGVIGLTNGVGKAKHFKVGGGNVGGTRVAEAGVHALTIAGGVRVSGTKQWATNWGFSGGGKF